MLHQVIERGILELKFVHLNQLLQDTRQQLLSEADESAQLKILQHHQLLKKTQMEIADRLGIVVS